MSKISEEDKALFRQAMQGVNPLHDSQVKRISSPKSQPTPSIKRKPIEQKQEHYYLSSYYAEPVQADEVLSYCKHPIPAKRLRELKSGQIPIEARLDLHGMHLDKACDSLCQFIDLHRNLAHRCLLIIHGKGGRHKEAPILKNHVNQWLQQIPHVLAFHSALARHGGNGAVYVLLKK